MEKEAEFLEEEGDEEELKELGEDSAERESITVSPSSDWKEIKKNIKIEDYSDEALSYVKTYSALKFKSNYQALRGVILEVGPGSAVSSVTMFPP